MGPGARAAPDARKAESDEGRCYRRPIDRDADDLDDVRTDAQEEWARWAASGYRKRFQPRSVLWFGAVFTVLMIAALLTMFWLATHGRL